MGSRARGRFRLPLSDPVAGATEVAVHYERPIQARATIRGVVLLQAGANLFGTLAVAIYFKLLFPHDSLRQGSDRLEVNLALLAGFVAITLLVTIPLNHLMLKRAMSWVREGRQPTTLERWDTLSQPLRLTFSVLLGWIGAAITFGIVNHDATRVGFGIALAGLVVCTLLYLMLERHFQPVFALALAGVKLPRWRREILTRVMGAWWLVSALPLLALGAAPFTDKNEVKLLTTPQFSVIAFFLVLAGALVMRAAVGGVSESVNEVRAAMAQVEEGDLGVRLPVSSIGELGHLQAGFNDMVEGLRQRRRLQDLFGRQVGVDVARKALEHDPELGGEEREISALFVDLAGFTSFSESLSPVEVVAALNTFFAVVIRVVMEEGGWVNKFEGDAALCIFGAPGDQPDHACRALAAAARLPGEVALLPDTPTVGIGVATGTAVAGNLGTAERYEYTVIGDTVNVASRLSDLAKLRATGLPVLAAGTTVAAASHDDPDVGTRWQAQGRQVVRGRVGAVEVFAPVDGCVPGNAASGGDAVALDSPATPEVTLPVDPQSRPTAAHR